MIRKQLGWRVDRWVLEDFQKLCEKEKLRGSEAVERFMRLTIECGSVTKALNLLRCDKDLTANEARVRILLEQIRRGAHWLPTEEQRSIFMELYDLLDKVMDPRLIDEVEKTLKARKYGT